MSEMKQLVCSCVGDSEEFLIDVLGMFTETTSAGSPYISLEGFVAATKKWGYLQVCLVLSLLDRLGYVEHYGSLEASSALTPMGEELRGSLPTEDEE